MEQKGKQCLLHWHESEIWKIRFVCTHIVIYLELCKEVKHKIGVCTSINWIHSHSVCACDIAS